MTLAFVSNYLTLHQIPLCDELYSALGEDFIFVSTVPMEAERIAMGWQEEQTRPYEKSIHDAGIEKKINGADVVLIGSAEEHWISNRLRNGKPVIRYSERILKHGRWHVLSPRAIKNVVSKHTAYRKAPVYLLCASAYAAGDYNLFGAYWNKSYKWGYFPETVPYRAEQIESNKNNSIVQLLWVGRFLQWKHPEYAILAAEHLQKKGYDFHLTMIGDGEQRERLCSMIHEKGLDERVTIFGFMKPAQVRSHMEKANVYLFTSDFLEGWGAVLNEAMNSGCAVVASHAIGAAPFLIKDGENGYLYKNGDANDLCEKIESLINDKNRMYQMGIHAYETISKQWNAACAAQRLIAFTAALADRSSLPVYQDGPLSKAGFLSNHWYRPGKYRISK